MRLGRGGGETTFRAPLLAAAVAAVAGCTSASETQASTPSLIWAGAERVGVFCQVTSYDVSVEVFETALCARVRALTGRNAPAPVQAVSPGDPAFIQNGTVILLVHGAVHRVDGRPLLAFTMRPLRPTAGDAVFFGTTPQAVPLSPTLTVDSRALDAALEAALSEVLPWRASFSSHS